MGKYLISSGNACCEYSELIMIELYSASGQVEDIGQIRLSGSGWASFEKVVLDCGLNAK